MFSLWILLQVLVLVVACFAASYFVTRIIEHVVEAFETSRARRQGMRR